MKIPARRYDFNGVPIRMGAWRGNVSGLQHAVPPLVRQNAGIDAWIIRREYSYDQKPASNQRFA